MTPDEMNNHHRIETLKARYCHAIDRKRWDDLGRIFTSDAELHKTVAGNTSITRTSNSIVQTIRTNLGAKPTMHYATNSIITLTSSTDAHGSWCALYMNGSDGSTGHGWYDDRFVLRDGAWLIERLSLTINFMR